MQELLRNQTITPRSESAKDSHQAAAEAVSRLRALQSSCRGLPAAHPAIPPAAPEPARLSLAPRKRRGMRPFALAAGACLALALALLSPALPGLLTGDTAADDSRGSGYVQVDRSVDRSYLVRDGDTLAEIAYVHGLDFSTLAAYNRLSNPDQLSAGQSLVIPSANNEKILKDRPSFTPVTLKSNRRGNAADATPLLIRADKQYDGAALTAHFSIESPAGTSFSAYEWDLGNGKRAFRESPYWSYEQPGTYTVRLNARLKDGAELVSNPLFIDVPHPGSFQGANQRFITLGNLHDTFRVPGTIESVSAYDSLDEAPISKVGQDGQVGVYQAIKPGFYAINFTENEQRSTVYLFASPIASVHSERSDMNWYRTQFNTGTLSNCGPSSVAMAYAWAKGGYLPVSSVRQAVGWRGNGSTSYEELTQVLVNNGIRNRALAVRKAEDLFQVIDRGNIAIILINTGGIRRSAGGMADLFGRYYTDVVGHYVVLKGYSADHKYLILHDPIPSDWSSNSFRFADGISMSGRNRYYAVDDVMHSLRTDTILEISRD
jgi:LysM repeat protein